MAAVLESSFSHPTKPCPFCGKLFRGLGNHLSHCPLRNGRNYLQYLSESTLAKKTKAKNQQCSQCKKWFKRLETHTRRSAQCKQVSFNFNVSPLSSIPLVEPYSAALDSHNVQLHGHNIQLHGHNIQLHQKSNCCSPSSDFLNPFNCPTSAEEWVTAD